jgi:hypothetical protein
MDSVVVGENSMRMFFFAFFSYTLLSVEEELLYTNISVDVFPLAPSYVAEFSQTSTSNNVDESDEEEKKQRRKREEIMTVAGHFRGDGTRSQ